MSIVPFLSHISAPNRILLERTRASDAVLCTSQTSPPKTQSNCFRRRKGCALSKWAYRITSNFPVVVTLWILRFQNIFISLFPLFKKMINGKIATKEEILDAISKNNYNHITATYYLLAERKLRREREHANRGMRLILWEAMRAIILSHSTSFRRHPKHYWMTVSSSILSEVSAMTRVTTIRETFKHHIRFLLYFSPHRAQQRFNHPSRALWR